MTDERLAELKEKYKGRNLLVELVWGAYANHMGYTSKQNGEFLNWLCAMAYKALKEKQEVEWIPIKTRKLTEEEKEEYPDSTFMYDCRLPEDGEEVLVTTWAGNVALDTFCRDDGCYFEYGCDDGDVTAWMPKPEPYKKGGAE